MALKLPVRKPIEELEEGGRLGGYMLLSPEEQPKLQPAVTPTLTPPRAYGQVSPWFPYESEAEYLAAQQGLRPPVSVSPLTLLKQARGVGAQVGQELAESLIGPQLTELERVGGMRQLLTQPEQTLSQVLSTWRPKQVTSPGTAKEIRERWEERPYGAIKAVAETALDPIAWIEGEMAAPFVGAGVRLGVKVAKPVIQRLYREGMDLVGRNLMNMGIREFGDDFLQRFAPIERMFNEGRMGQTEATIRTSRIINDLRGEAPMAERAAERLRRLPVAQAGRPAMEFPITPERWAGMTVPQRVRAAEAVGLSGRIGSKAWEALTEQERAALIGKAPEAPPPTAMQAGMGIGEQPPQGELFAEYGKGAAPQEQVPLIDRESLEAKAAREAEIARGQAEMGMPRSMAEILAERDALLAPAEKRLEEASDTMKGLHPAALDWATEAELTRLEELNRELSLNPEYQELMSPEAAARRVAERRAARLEAEATPVLTGNRTMAYGPDPSKPYEMQYRLVELDDLIPSHTDTLTPNPDYPSDLQPRIRERGAARLQVTSMAERLVPEALVQDTYTLDRGLPIIGPDMVVESGNGRVLAMRQAAMEYPERWAAYQEALRDSLAQYGIPEESLEGMRNPVIVRERTSEVNRVKFSQEANQPAVMAMSPLENALTDATRIRLENLFIPEETGSIDATLRLAANRDFIKDFLNTLPTNEQAMLLDATGELNLLGMERVKAALFARTYRGEAGRRLTEIFFESREPLVRNIEEGMMASLPKMANAEDLIAAGDREAGLSIAEDLAKSLDMFARLKQRRLSVPLYLEQLQMFERELSSFQEQLLRYVDTIARSPKAIREFLGDYADAVVASPAPQQAAMLDVERPTKEAILNAVVKREAETPLFAAEAGPAVEAPRAPERVPVERVPRVPVAEEKQPWQMTKAEFEASYPKLNDLPVEEQRRIYQLVEEANLEQTGEETGFPFEEFQEEFGELQFDEGGGLFEDHEFIVQNAVRANQPVPDAVLAEYPKLAKQVERRRTLEAERAAAKAAAPEGPAPKKGRRRKAEKKPKRLTKAEQAAAREAELMARPREERPSMLPAEITADEYAIDRLTGQFPIPEIGRLPKATGIIPKKGPPPKEIPMLPEPPPYGTPEYSRWYRNLPKEVKEKLLAGEPVPDLPEWAGVPPIKMRPPMSMPKAWPAKANWLIDMQPLKWYVEETMKATRRIRPSAFIEVEGKNIRRTEFLDEYLRALRRQKATMAQIQNAYEELLRNLECPWEMDENGVITKGSKAIVGKAVGDVMEWAGRKMADLTPKESQFIRNYRYFLRSLEDWAQKRGAKLPKDVQLQLWGGGRPREYFPRFVEEVRGITRLRGMIRGGIGARQTIEFPRDYPFQIEGIEAGVDYLTDLPKLGGLFGRMMAKKVSDAELLADLLPLTKKAIERKGRNPLGWGEAQLLMRGFAGRKFPAQLQFGGKTYSGAEFAERILRTIFPPEPGIVDTILHWLAVPGNIARNAKVIVDLATGFIQPWPLLTGASAPFRKGAMAKGMSDWASVIGESIYASVHPSVLREHRLANWEQWARFIEAGGTIRTGVEFIGTPEASLMARIPLVGEVVQRAQVAFGTALDLGVFKHYQALSDYYEAGVRPPTELVDFVQKLQGVPSVWRILKPHSLQEFERSFGAFAPDMLRSTLAMYEDFFKPGLEGQLARRGIMKFWIGTAFLLTALAGLYDLAFEGEMHYSNPLNKDYILNPDSRFWSRLPFLGEIYVGISNMHLSVMRTVLGVALALARGDVEDAIDDLTWFGRSRMAVTAQMLRTVTTRRTYLGKRIEGAGPMAKELLSYFLPIWGEQAMEVGGAEGALAGVLEFFGLNVGVITAYQKLDMAREQVSQWLGKETWGDLTALERVDAAKRFSQLGELETEYKAEREPLDLNALIAQQRRSGEEVQGMLDRDLQEEMALVGESVGQIGRSITIPGSGGQKYYLDDEQFKSLQEATARAIDDFITRAVSQKAWASKTPEQKAAIIDKAISDGRARGRAEVLKAVSGTKPLAVPTIAPTGVSPIPDWLLQGAGIK